MIRPIVERLPNFLQSKWEKEIVKYAAKNHDAYPDFHVFAYMVQGEARKKNHPNVQASGVQTTTHGERPSKKAAKDNPTSTRRVLKTNTGKEEANRCKFHNRDGHTLTECKAFNAMTMEEKTDWISREERRMERSSNPTARLSARREGCCAAR